MADEQYYQRRADAEIKRINLAASPEARAAHEQLHALYRERISNPPISGNKL